MPDHPQSHDHLASPSSGRWQRIDELCAEFLTGCQNGDPPAIEDLLKGLDGDVRTIAFRELLKTLLQLSEAESTEIDTQDLRSRFPDMGEIVDSVLAGAGETVAFHGGATSLSATATARAREAAMPESLGRYQLQRPLGEGGMGTVYLARDTKLDRLVALKIPNFGDDDRDVLIERFYREARTMAAINHVNLCTVHDVCEIDGTHCLIMEYVDGRSLAQQLARQPVLPWEDAVTIAVKLARALQLAHDAGVVHRDLKPSNVLLQSDGEPVLTDFGLARELFTDPDASAPGSGSSLTQTGALLGTPMYMSPEQVEADHDNVGPATDIYSLGVILYLMLSGRLPFEGSIARVLGRIATEAPDPPSTHNPDVDPRLEAVCLKAMAKNPADRQSSAAELAEELNSLLLPATQQMAAVASPDAQRPSAKPKLFTAAVAVVILVAVIAWKFRSETADLPQASGTDSPVLITEEQPVPAGREQTLPVPDAAASPSNRATADSRVREQAADQILDTLFGPDGAPSNTDLPAAPRPPDGIVKTFESASGIVNERFLLCFELPFSDLGMTIEPLREAGHVPVMIRPYVAGNETRVAALWLRSDSDWHLATDLTYEQLQAEDTAQSGDGRTMTSICACRELFTAVWSEADEKAAWRYLENSVGPNSVYSPAEALAVKGLRPVTLHARFGRGLYDLTQIWKPAPPGWELTRQRSLNTGRTTYDRGEGLLDAQLIPTGPTTASCVFLWQDIPDTESAIVYTNGFQEQVDHCRELAGQGWSPASVSITSRPRANNEAACSVWRRRLPAE